MIFSDFLPKSKLELVLLSGGNISRVSKAESILKISWCLDNFVILNAFFTPWAKKPPRFHPKIQVSIIQGEDGKLRRKESVSCNEPETRRWIKLIQQVQNDCVWTSWSQHVSGVWVLENRTLGCKKYWNRRGFFHQKEKMETHLFPHLPKKATVFNQFSWSETATFRTHTQRQAQQCPKLKLEVSNLFDAYMCNQTIWEKKSIKMCYYGINQGITQGKSLASPFQLGSILEKSRPWWAAAKEGAGWKRMTSSHEDGHQTP